MELVQEEVLDALRAGVLQRLGPEVTRDVGELPREREHREVEHESERQPRVRLGGFGEAHQRRRVGKLARDVSRGNLHAVPPELVLRERREGVGNLFDEIASREVRVCEESTREDESAPMPSAAAARVSAAAEVGEPGALEPAHAGPVRDLVRLEPVEQNVEVEAGDVVTHQHVRVQLLQLGEQKARETALRGLRGQHHRAGSLRHRVLGVLLRHRRVPAGRERDPVQPAHDGKVPEVVNEFQLGVG